MGHGVSRDIIAKDNQIGTGTVSTNITDLKMMALFLTFSEKLHYCSSITLLPSSVKAGSSEMQIDSVIEKIDVHCFRRCIAVEQFVGYNTRNICTIRQSGNP
jgi:hypothetical protein